MAPSGNPWGAHLPFQAGRQILLHCLLCSEYWITPSCAQRLVQSRIHAPVSLVLTVTISLPGYNLEPKRTQNISFFTSFSSFFNKFYKGFDKTVVILQYQPCQQDFPPTFWCLVSLLPVLFVFQLHSYNGEWIHRKINNLSTLWVNTTVGVNNLAGKINISIKSTNNSPERPALISQLLSVFWTLMESLILATLQAFCKALRAVLSSESKEVSCFGISHRLIDFNLDQHRCWTWVWTVLQLWWGSWRYVMTRRFLDSLNAESMSKPETCVKVSSSNSGKSTSVRLFPLDFFTGVTVDFLDFEKALISIFTAFGAKVCSNLCASFIGRYWHEISRMVFSFLGHRWWHHEPSTVFIFSSERLERFSSLARWYPSDRFSSVAGSLVTIAHEKHSSPGRLWMIAMRYRFGSCQLHIDLNSRDRRFWRPDRIGIGNVVEVGLCFPRKSEEQPGWKPNFKLRMWRHCLGTLAALSRERDSECPCFRILSNPSSEGHKIVLSKKISRDFSWGFPMWGSEISRDTDWT